MNRSAAEVWKRVGSYCAIGEWMQTSCTITAGKGWWQLPVGGGIVAQSIPQREYEETWHKATGLLKALR